MLGGCEILYDSFSPRFPFLESRTSFYNYPPLLHPLVLMFFHLFTLLFFYCSFIVSFYCFFHSLSPATCAPSLSRGDEMKRSRRTNQRISKSVKKIFQGKGMNSTKSKRYASSRVFSRQPCLYRMLVKLQNGGVLSIKFLDASIASQ